MSQGLMGNIDQILRHLDETRSRLLDEVADLDADQFRRQPSPTEWSAAQVLDHLALVESQLSRHFRAMVEGKVPTTVRMVDRLRRLPPRLAAYRLIKAQNPRSVTPGDVQPKEQLLARLAQSRVDLKALIAETRERELSKLRFAHLALGGFNLYEWFAFIGYHEERHRKQIVEIKSKIL
ncbi:MAG: DinB family protein [Candidatus Methylomirabilales bacterium]